MQIGYIGLGDMGGALAARLQLTYPLKVYDLNEKATIRLRDAGAEVCRTAQELAQSCDVIFTCLPKSKHVDNLLFGQNGLKPHLKSGALIVDQTTGDPNDTRAMAQALTQHNIALIDAPVSGGAAGAKAGTIAIMVGADDAHYQKVLPVLHAISPNVFHAGQVGAGHTIKLVNNLLSGAQRLLSMECLALAQKNGIDLQTAVNILNAGGGRNVFLEKGVQPLIENGDVGKGFTLALMHKDIDLACKVGSDSAMPMNFGTLTKELYRMAMNLIGEERPVNSAALMIDEISGSKIVAEPTENSK